MEVGDHQIRSERRVSPFTKEDLPDLASFFKAQSTGIDGYGSVDFFQWKILDNCRQPGIINLVKEENKIISTTSVTPKELILHGKRQIVGEIGDTYTDSHFQRQGLFSLLINRSTQDALKAAIPFIYGTPNKQSLPGYEKKANYKTLPELELKSLFLPINLRPFFQRKTNWFIGTLIGFLFQLFMFVFVSLKRLVTAKGIGNVENVEQLDDSWDIFWETACKGYDFIFARDKKNFTWRFFKNPNKYHVSLIKEEGAIKGYVVWRLIHGTGQSKLVIADYLCISGHEKSLKKVLLKIMKDSFSQNINYLNVWCPKKSPYFNLFKGLGFREIETVPVICYQNGLAAQIKANCHGWHFTISDSDNV